MVSCPNCYEQVQEQYKFCPTCGRRLDKNVHESDFELGRIAALETIKQDIRNWAGGGALLIVLLGLLIGGFSITTYIESSVDKAVRDEIGKISDNLKNLADIFPIIEYDFYRIRTINIGLSITDYQERKIIPDFRHEDVISPYAGNEYHTLSFTPEPKANHYSIRIEYSYKSLQHLQGKTIDELIDMGKLKIYLTASITNVNGLEENQRLLKYIKYFNFMITINNSIFDTHNVPINTFVITETRKNPKTEIPVMEKNKMEIFLEIVDKKGDFREVREKYVKQLKKNQRDQKER